VNWNTLGTDEINLADNLIPELITEKIRHIVTLLFTRGLIFGISDCYIAV